LNKIPLVAGYLPHSFRLPGTVYMGDAFERLEDASQGIGEGDDVCEASSEFFRG
jgi:hypothetical protein